VDIRQLCAWGRRHWATFVVWESVCQALTVGRRLVEDEEARFRGKGYDVTHVLLTTADFGSAQNRRRYFFVASRVRFEPLPPPRVAQPTTGDVLSPHLGRDVTPMKPVTVGSTPDVCRALNRDERSVLRLLREGESLNHLAVDRHDELAAASERYGDRALFRRSGQPFGLHALRRLRWDAVCPTLHSGCRNLLHPRLDRTLSVREVAALMGWDDHPVGERPYEQCVKGIVPAVGEWVARSVETSLGNSGAEGIARRVDLRKGDASWT
jgi:site-specific DNA-cytosine methylase